MNEPHETTDLRPSQAGSVVLDVGGSVGALVLYAPEALAGAEVEVARLGLPGHTTHSSVRHRQLAPGLMVCAAVYPEPARRRVPRGRLRAGGPGRRRGG